VTDTIACSTTDLDQHVTTRRVVDCVSIWERVLHALPRRQAYLTRRRRRLCRRLIPTLQAHRSCLQTLFKLVLQVIAPTGLSSTYCRTAIQSLSGLISNLQ